MTTERGSTRPRTPPPAPHRGVRFPPAPTVRTPGRTARGQDRDAECLTGTSLVSGRENGLSLRGERLQLCPELADELRVGQPLFEQLQALAVVPQPATPRRR